MFVKRLPIRSLRLLNVNVKPIRYFSKSTIKKSNDAPDEFYDENIENDKEFFDIVSSMSKSNSLRSLPILNVSL